jgi:tRNA A58 N-methylase Trm61
MNKDNITKKSNLESNDSLSCYLGHEAQQNPHAFEVFYNFLEKEKPKRIIEIGTALGGFTMFLKLSCNELGLNTEIVTYDINGRHGYKLLREVGVDVRIENIFYEDYKEVKQDVINYIQEEGVTAVLCDGGYKIGEFNLLSQFLKKGDFIMAHDYAESEKTFVDKIDKKYWNWLEIQDTDIKESVDRYNLISYNKEDFDKAVWVCKVKE